MPSSNAPSSSAGATATDFSTPRTSVNQSRTKRMSRSSNVRRTNSCCLSMMREPSSGSTVVPRNSARHRATFRTRQSAARGDQGVPAGGGRGQPLVEEQPHQTDDDRSPVHLAVVDLDVRADLLKREVAGARQGGEYRRPNQAVGLRGERQPSVPAGRERI